MKTKFKTEIIFLQPLKTLLLAIFLANLVAHIKIKTIFVIYLTLN